MDMFFEILSKDKPRLVALLEADPYGKTSFSRNGYKMKEGAQIGQDKEKGFLFIKCTDEFAKFAKEKLAGMATEAKAEAAAAVVKAIEAEESSAEVGFGSIFGES